MADAVPSGDTRVLERMLADSFQGTDEEGIPYNKQSLIDQARLAADHFLSYRVTDLKIAIHGNTATTTGIYVWEHKPQGNLDTSPRSGKTAFTHTWQWHSGKWQVLEEHMGGQKKVDA